MKEENQVSEQHCTVFGVNSGGMVIGLGVLLILFGIIPLFIIKAPLPVTVSLLFIVFGFYLIWAGLSK